MKKILLWLMVLVISISMFSAFLLTGCKEESATAEESAIAEESAVAEESETAEESAEEPDGEKPFEGTTITVTSLNAAWADAAIALLPEFTEKTGIEVIWEPLPFDSIHEKQVVDMSAGTGIYDVISFDNPWVAEFGSSGWLEPLDALVAESNYDIDDYPSNIIEYWKWDGELVALPYEPDVRMIFYRKDLFENAGITKLPETWEELEEAAAKLTDPENGIYGFDFSPARTIVAVVEILPYIRGNGSDIFNDDLEVTINSPAAIKGLEFYAAMKEYAPPGIENRAWDDLLNNAIQGTTAMSIQPSVFAGNMENAETSKVVGKVGYFPIPRSADGTNSASIGGWSMAIPKSSTHKEAAWEFISWVTSKEIEKERALTPGAASTPVRISSLEDPEIAAQYVPTMLESFKVAQYANKWHIKEWAKVEDLFTLSISRAMNEEQTPQESFDQLYEELLTLMTEAGYYQ